MLGSRVEKINETVPCASLSIGPHVSVYISWGPELALAVQNDDERQAGIEQGSGDMQKKTVCLLDVALSSGENNSTSCHLRKLLQSLTDQYHGEPPMFLDLGIRK